MKQIRKSAIVLHPTSLPGPYGIGTLGKEAYEFLDFLIASGQKIWQVLPLGPTGYGDCPYSALSAFAGNPYLIDMDLLIEEAYSLRSNADRSLGFQRIMWILGKSMKTNGMYSE